MYVCVHLIDQQNKNPFFFDVLGQSLVEMYKIISAKNTNHQPDSYCLNKLPKPALMVWWPMFLWICIYVKVLLMTF